MAKVLNGITIIVGIILIFWFIHLDYSDLTWKTNRYIYLSIISLVIIGISLQINRINLTKKKNKENDH